MQTSLAEIRSFFPCQRGWVAVQQQPYGYEEPFDISECFKTNPLGDILWLLDKKQAPRELALSLRDKMLEDCSEYEKQECAAITDWLVHTKTPFSGLLELIDEISYAADEGYTRAYHAILRKKLITFLKEAL